MLTRQFLNIYGIIGAAFMVVVLVLVWLKIAPREYYLPLFLAAFVIWTSRLVMRMLLARKERQEESDDAEPPNPYIN